MNVVRQVYESLPKTINTPSSLKNRRVEVIMLPLDEDVGEINMKTGENVESIDIDEFFGAWEGEPLVRPDQGEFELREQLK